MSVLTKCSKFSCNNCGNNFKYCSNCKSVSYCCKECQVEDWRNHKKFCKTLVSTNVLELKEYQRSKGVSKNKTRGEIIGLWAREYFKAVGSKDIEQFIVVNVNIKKNTAEFSINSDAVKQAKDTFIKEQKALLDQYKNNLVIYIKDVNSLGMEIMMSSHIKDFDSGVFVMDIIDL